MSRTLLCKRKAQLFICVILFVEMLVIVYFEELATAWEDNDVSLRVASILNDKNVTAYLGKKRILLWTSFMDEDWLEIDETVGQFDHCPMYNNCFITRSRNLVDTKKFNAILFHGKEINRRDLPRTRSPRQKYVFLNLESPKNWPLADSFLDDYFNLTMTYRLDSHIPWLYYIMRDINSGEMVAPLQRVEWASPSHISSSVKYNLKFDGKRQMVAWLIDNNCTSYGRRELYVEKLEQYVQVDKIGKCAELAIPDCMKSTTDCFGKIIGPNYLFYLAFEDALCQDYITENFFNALRYEVIPVVYGGANYSLFAPPHSYIDALDYESPEELGNYLTKLAQDREEYLKYFWWKEYYTIESPRNWTMCKICEVLSAPKPQLKTYSPLSKWFLINKCPMQNFVNVNKYATKELKSRIIQPRRVPRSSD